MAEDRMSVKKNKTAKKTMGRGYYLHKLEKNSL
jgi:hypothetical protein